MNGTEFATRMREERRAVLTEIERRMAPGQRAIVERALGGGMLARLDEANGSSMLVGLFGRRMAFGGFASLLRP